MIKRMLLMLLAMTLVVGGVLGYKLFGRYMMNKAMAGQRPPPVTVGTAEAQSLTWQPTLRAVGTFVAMQGITVSAQLDGAVTQIAFESDTLVKAGDLLVQQDISTERAQLDSAEAAAALAKLSLDRGTQLRAQGSNAQSDLDTANASYQQAQANAAAIRATIEKKTIRAPFAGSVGIRQVSLGQFLRSGAAVVPLQAVDPIYFNFALPQQNAGRVQRGQEVTVTVDAFPGETFKGTVNALNPNVDDATRSLQIQATLTNPAVKLRPGMFGSAELQLPAVENVITVPLSAIVYNPYGDAVYLVESADPGGAGLVVRQQFVQTGAKRGDQIAILKGVKVGATVVTAGQLKLRNGAAVVVNNTVLPANSPAPKPEHP